MANIKRIDGKTGTSYKITVTSGRDMDGKQIRHFKTWTPAPKMTERQIETAVQKAAFEFEQSIEQGYIADNRQTFAQYAEYVISLKESVGAKYKTIASYKHLLERINAEIGYMKLSEIRPQRLNAFYKRLASPSARKGQQKATPKVDIAGTIKDIGKTRTEMAEKAGVSHTTITLVCRGGTVNKETADKIAVALQGKTEKLFKIEDNSKPLSPKTILEYHRCIHAILAQAEKEMLVPYNAATKATPPKQTRKEVNYFQPEDLTCILDALELEPIKWRTITHLLIVTGCRRGEIAAIKWSKVDFANRQIRIDASLLYDAKKGIYENSTKTGDLRILKLPVETMNLLRDYKQWYVEQKFKNGDRWHDTGYLFVQDDGRPMNPTSITSWMNKFSKRNDFPHINPHAFRHTVASVLINNGQDIVTVSKRLGHSRTSTTLDVYSHIIQEADAVASECIADVLLRKKA